ncbi:MAG TPA: rhomboid family intramembrane serine protease [Mycobacteriales bacterium]|nr:rhomboid family intramembrane serine protease [Mycobacteriales bacterium]
MSEGAGSVRAPRTAFGGRITDDTSRVSITLVVLNVAIFVVGLAVGEQALRRDYGNVAGPALLTPGGPLVGVAMGEYYRLVTAAFLHAGLLHLGLNMMALAVLGPPLESALGRGRFLALYLLSALGGSVTAFLLAPANTLGVGASGAIFGLFGAYYVVVRRLGGETGAIVGLLAVNLVVTFAVPFIDWRAHLGGLVVGTVVATALAYAPRGPHRTAVQVAACGAVGVVLVVLVLLREAALTG